MPWPQRHWVWWQEGRCRLLFAQRWRCTPETSLSRLTSWRQLVVRTFARGLEATTCPLNMKKANMFPISPDTWSIRVHHNLFKSLVFKIPQSYIVGALEILFENKQNLEHRPNNAGVPAYCLRVAAYGQEISLRHSNYVALPHFRNRRQ